MCLLLSIMPFSTMQRVFIVEHHFRTQSGVKHLTVVSGAYILCAQHMYLYAEVGGEHPASALSAS
jgi:hypothetical protein